MIRKKSYKNKSNPRSFYIMGIVTGLSAAILFIVLIPNLISKSSRFLSTGIPFIKSQPTVVPTINSQAISQQVLPEKLDLGVSFGSTIKELVENGAIDKQKFLELYQNRGGLPAEFASLLDNDSSQNIIVTNENSGIILNLLWPLGIANKTKTLSQGPMGTEYKDEAGNFASTGGWTMGKVEGGQLFNRYNILPLTDEQEALVTEISQKIFRPCCGNSTFFPDCNHGAAMLGFIELAVAQGMPKEEIYKKALVLNSYWFPQTYVELAMYFKSEKNLDWDKVDPVEVLGQEYSSGGGYAKINQQLTTKGILPKVEGGGGCGV